MSPLARSLLVLSCAALLHAACATYPEYDPGYCKLLKIGDKNGYNGFERKIGPTLIRIPPPPISTEKVDIAQLIRPGIELVEEVVIVCSLVPWGPPPIVLPPPEGFSPIEVQASNDIFNFYSRDLTMTVYQYYKIVSPDHPHYYS